MAGDEPRRADRDEEQGLTDVRAGWRNTLGVLGRARATRWRGRTSLMHHFVGLEVVHERVLRLLLGGALGAALRPGPTRGGRRGEGCRTGDTGFCLEREGFAGEPGCGRGRRCAREGVPNALPDEANDAWAVGRDLA